MRKIELPKPGDRHKTNEGYTCVVLEYRNASNVLVRFEDEQGATKVVRTGDLRRGEVANPFHRAFFGVGYWGLDENLSQPYNSKGREYMFWKGMIERCYSEKSLLRSPRYFGCKVEKDFQSLQLFGTWCQDQKGFHEKGWQLDKDLLTEDGRGRLYCKEFCIFVPGEINCLFIEPNRKDDGLPLGVSFCKDRNKYQAGCGGGGYRVALGRYITAEEAYNAYITYKKQRVCDLIEKYQERVDSRLILKLESFVKS